MSTSRMSVASRQAAILATICGLHVGAFVLAVAGLGPRLDWLQPASPPFIYVPVEGNAAAEPAAGSVPAVAVPDVRGPSSVLRDMRLAALVDACYPAASRRLSEEGRVVVRDDVDATGRASAWIVAGSSGFARLDAAVACVIRRLEFNPGRRDGAAVAASVTLPIVFRQR